MRNQIKDILERNYYPKGFDLQTATDELLELCGKKPSPRVLATPGHDIPVLFIPSELPIGPVNIQELKQEPKLDIKKLLINPKFTVPLTRGERRKLKK